MNIVTSHYHCFKKLERKEANISNFLLNFNNLYFLILNGLIFPFSTSVGQYNSPSVGCAHSLSESVATPVGLGLCSLFSVHTWEAFLPYPDRSNHIDLNQSCVCVCVCVCGQGLTITAAFIAVPISIWS